MRNVRTLFAAGLLLVSGWSHAQSPTSSGQTPQDQPTRGMTMSRVESTYGAPTNRLAAVGQPPITRWEYPGFVVYFEHQHVIHAVRR